MSTNKVIDNTEIDDFNQLLSEFGRKESEFSIVELLDPVSGTGIHHITGTVQITHLKTGTKRKYKAGDCTAWVAEFRKDLEECIFPPSS